MTGVEDDAWELCPSCGARLAPEAERCGRCSAALSAPPADAPGVLVVQDLVPVFSGSRESVLALQAALACEGFASVIPDLHVRTMVDPFAIGGNCLGFDLLAARDQAPAIEAAIAKLRGE